MPAKATPRPWTRLDREYLAQRRVRALGIAFGPGGPLAFLECILLAGKAVGVEAGRFEVRADDLAYSAFLDDTDIARAVLSAAEASGLVADLQDDGERLSARLTRWAAWESTAKTDAERQADYRERKRHESHERHA